MKGQGNKYFTDDQYTQVFVNFYSLKDSNIEICLYQNIKKISILMLMPNYLFRFRGFHISAQIP